MSLGGVSQPLGEPLYPRLRAGPEATGDPRLTVGLLLPNVGLMIAAGLLAATVGSAAAGIVFLVGYACLTAVNPTAGLCLMFGSAPFINDIGGLPVKVAIPDLCMIIALATLIFRWASESGRFAFAPAYVPILAYLAICILSTALVGFPPEAVTSTVQMIIYTVLAVFFFSNLVKIREVLPALYAQLASCCFLAVLLVAGGGGYVLGLHKNAAGTSMAFAVLIAMELWIRAGLNQTPRRLLTCVLIVCCLGLVVTLSRGAWLGTLCGCMVIMLLRGQVMAMVKAAAGAVPIVAIVFAMLPDNKVDYATDLSASAHNVKARIESINFAYEQFASSPLIGVGVGLRKLYDATNLVMSTLAETGVLGLVTFLAIFITFAWMAFVTSRRIPKGNLMFSFLAIGSALMTCKFVHGLVDHYWSRGILPVWAGAGFIVSAYVVSGRQLAQRGRRI